VHTKELNNNIVSPRPHTCDQWHWLPWNGHFLVNGDPVNTQHAHRLTGADTFRTLMTAFADAETYIETVKLETLKSILNGSDSLPPCLGFEHERAHRPGKRF
jgi:hypothetical protein